MFENVNEVAILVAALLAVAVGNIWYSPIVFGPLWMRSVGKNPGDDVLPKNKIAFAVAGGVVTQMIFFYVLAQFLSGSDADPFSLANLGVLVILLVSAQVVSVTIWEQKPMAYFLINAGYIAVVTIVGLSVISYWPW